MLASWLAPIGQQDQQVGYPHDVVKVDVGRARIRPPRTRAPFPKEHHQISDTDGTIAVKITWDIRPGRTTLDASLFLAGDETGALPPIGKKSDATNELPVVRRIVRTFGNQVRHGATVLEEQVPDTAIAAVDDDGFRKIGVGARIFVVWNAIVVGILKPGKRQVV